MENQTACRDARLALVVEDAERGAADRLGEVGVLKDDVRALAAELKVHLLQVLGGALGDSPADSGAAGEGDLGNVGMVDDALPRGMAISGDDVDNAFGKTDLRYQLG